MLYISRFRPKESVQGGGLEQINKIIDTGIIPAMEKVEGVQSVQAYNSITGDVVFVLDIRDMATVDRIMADPGCNTTLSAIGDYLMRSGGEILYDRPAWQGLYGEA